MIRSVLSLVARLADGDRIADRVPAIATVALAVGALTACLGVLAAGP